MTLSQIRPEWLNANQVSPFIKAGSVIPKRGKYFLSIFSLSLFLCLNCFFAGAQKINPRLSKPKIPDKEILKINSLLASGYQQLDLFSSNGGGLDSARHLSKIASSLSTKINYAHGVDATNLLIARTYLAKGDIKTAKSKFKDLKKESQVELWISLANQSIRITRTKAHIDSALNYINYASSLAKTSRSDALQTKVRSQLAKIQVLTGNVEQGKENYNIVFNYYSARNKEWELARSLGEMTSNIPYIAKYYDDVLLTADRAIKLYTRLNRPDSVAWIRSCKANLYLVNAKNQLAEQELLKVIDIYKATNNPQIYLAYDGLSIIYSSSGNNEKALKYIIASINSATQSGNTNGLDDVYQKLGSLYYSIGQTDKAIEAYQMAFDILKKKDSAAPGVALVLTRSMADAMVAKGKVKEALSFIDEMEKKYPPQSAMEKTVLPGIRAKCYYRLKQYDKAEQYNLEAVSISEKLGPGFSANAIYLLSNFYMRTNQLEKARPYVNTLKSLPKDVLPAPMQKTLYYSLFRIDSAAGDFIKAIYNYKMFKYVNDTIYYSENNRKVLELQAQYESDKKDKDILLKQKNIQILEKQGLLQKTLLQQASLQMRLEQQEREQENRVMGLENDKKEKNFMLVKFQAKEKDDNIANLTREGQLQKKLLVQAKLNKNLMFAGISLLALVVILLFTSYRNKQRANRILNAQKEEISEQNISLKELVERKNSLLIEKEWLVKEIHHRVKNNLQIVISLLKAQTDYLDNDVALLAIQQSQHRMHAMSLIHQKLYQTESMTSIDIHEYVQEMVGYFSESMDQDKKIQFCTDVLPLKLNIGQAIPLGLILNESITNAIKYAFYDIVSPKIEIILSEIGPDLLRLTIADNGKGLDNDFDPEKAESLGMSLIFGLSKQLGGHCTIKNQNGLSVNIEFKGNLTSGETSYLAAMSS